ncbi:MAG: glycosyltransferase [Oligoflexia bacterium]|nr:glycosyltransferase [Oligoflexia bacterium]
MPVLQNPILPPLIIPAYQPDPSLVLLVEELISLGFSSIVVVNDGSRPEKTAVLDKLSQKNEVTLLHHAVNLGKGAALKTAFNHILVNQPNVKGVVTVDADGQHRPGDVLKVAQELLQSANSLILGSRAFQGEVPLRSRFGNLMTRNIFRLLIGKKLVDTQTGLRGIPTAFLSTLLPIKSTRYEFELDMLITAVRSGYSLNEVAIATVYENNNQSSHFNPFLDSFRIYFIFLRFISLSLVTYMTDLIIFSIVYYFSGQVFNSVLFGRLGGAVVNVTGSKIFVFKSDKKMGKVLVQYATLWLSLLGISYALMILFVEQWHFNVYFSRVAVDSTLFLFNFVIQRDLIFRPPEVERS